MRLWQSIVLVGRDHRSHEGKTAVGHFTSLLLVRGKQQSRRVGAPEETKHLWGFPQHVNYTAIIDSDGDIVERYEYTPYGQRTAYKSSGSNDDLTSAPILNSQPWTVSGIDQPYGINEVGHQGLFHDKEFGLIYNRARMRHPMMACFVQRDRTEYADASNSVIAPLIMWTIPPEQRSFVYCRSRAVSSPFPRNRGIQLMRAMTIGFIGLVLSLGVFQGTSCSRCEHANQGQNQMSPERGDYQQRWSYIVAQYHTIIPGMSSNDVEQDLGKPDQIHPLYEPRKHNPKRIGTSWFYKRRPLPGDQRGDREIVVRFDLRLVHNR